MAVSCRVCKEESLDETRAVCAKCLTRSLELACRRGFVSPRGASNVASGERRTHFPGMPKVVPPRTIEFLPRSGRRDVPSRVLAATRFMKAHIDINRPTPHVSADEDLRGEGLAGGRPSGSENVDPRHGGEGRLPGSANGKPLLQGNPLPIRNSVRSRKMDMFVLEKKIFLRIPGVPCLGPPAEPPPAGLAAPRKSVVSFLSTHVGTSFKEIGHRTSSVQTDSANRFRKWTVKADASAEADLMRRLLAGSMPAAQVATRILLPPCKVRPPSPTLSPPGIPLWKRRCVPCPQTLHVQPVGLCAS